MKKFLDRSVLHIGLFFIVIVCFWAAFVRAPWAMTGLVAVIALGFVAWDRLPNRR